MSSLADSLKRTSTRAFILLVGSTGAGKSATINHLLNTGNEVAKTGESEPGTKETSEFVLPLDDHDNEDSSRKLSIIDTPGLDLDSIKNFLRSHPLFSKFPNLIILLVRASDHRIELENSGLSKTLRVLKELGVVDQRHPNVVAVLTFCCSVPFCNAPVWEETMKGKKNIISRLVSHALGVRAPVVLLENNYDYFKLEKDGDFTLLPNKERQPENLYRACQTVLEDNGDHYGLLTFNTRIAKPDDKKQDDVDCQEFGDVTNCGVRNPIHNTVLQYIKEEKLKPSEKKELKNVAEALKQLGAGDPPDFGSHSVQSIERFLGSEISSTGRNMLEEKFGIAMEPTDLARNLVPDNDSGRLVGQGYNILTDKSVSAQAMKFVLTKTQCGVVIPTCAKFEDVPQTKYFMDQFEDDKSYMQSRLNSLNLNLAVNPSILKMDCRAGYNKKSASKSSSSTSEYSFLFEQRMFELKIGNYQEYKKNGMMTFTEDFKSAVKDLPTEYDKSDPSCRSKFERFFDRFGHFLVSSAYAGGSVAVKYTREVAKSQSMNFAEARACLAASFEGLDVAKAEVSAGVSTFARQDAQAFLNRCTHDWEGGDRALQAKETIADKEKFQKWKDSLLQKPTMLTSEMSLEPISTVVGCVDAQKDQTTYDALKDLLRGEFKTRADEEKRAAERTTKKMERATARIENAQERNQSCRKCFPSMSVVNVQIKDGEVKQKKIMNLEVGDKVMGWNEKRNRAVFTEVIMFAHRASHAMDVQYMKIVLEDGNKITLTGNHLVMVGKHKKAIMAQEVKLGDILFTVDENREISPKKVLAVEKVIDQGVYCPITLHGNLIVDNVLASCYASVEDHVFLQGLVKISAQSLAHCGLMPMRSLHKFRLKWLRNIPNGQTMHPYLQWLCKLKLPFMAN